MAFQNWRPANSPVYTRDRLPSCCFKDGLRKIDFVIVYPQEYLAAEIESQVIRIYVAKLQEVGLEVEQEMGRVLDNKVFLKIHVPNRRLPQLASDMGVELMCNNPYFKNEAEALWTWLDTLLTRPDLQDPLFPRARETLSGDQPRVATDAERILVAYRLISRAECPVEEGSAVNLHNLLRDHILSDAYPLHDTPARWTYEGPLSDRQLLARYWVSIRAMLKEQPLNLIEKYCGPEVAFYFAWMGHCTGMMVYASFIGAMLVVFAIIYLFVLSFTIAQDDVCHSDMVLCPRCLKEKYCPFVPFKNYCLQAGMAHVLDNPLTVIYTVIMSVWGVIFIVTWKRKEALLRLRWNMTAIQADRTMRREFLEQEPEARISSVTKTPEYYFSFVDKLPRHIFTGIVMTLVIAAMMGVTMAIYVTRKVAIFYGSKSNSRFLRRHIVFIEDWVSSYVVAFIIGMLSYLYYPIAGWLTTIEVHRSDRQYQNSFIAKVFVISAANNFFYIMYLSFFKGKFYTFPGHNKDFTILSGLKTEPCSPVGCIVDLALVLFAIVVTKRLKAYCRYLFFTHLKQAYLWLMHKLTGSVYEPTAAMPQWEKDYLLNKFHSNDITKMYTDEVLKYAFVVCFVSAFPLAPFLSVISSALSMRTNAMALLVTGRRNVPQQVPDIGTWKQVVEIITLVGAFTNPLVLSMNSNFIPKLIYRTKHGKLRGFYQSTFSEYETTNIEFRKNSPYKNLTTCYYVGKRYPPSSPKKYQLTADYWYEMAIKGLFFVVLENVILLVFLILSYNVKEVPRRIKVRMEYEQQELKAYRQIKNP